MMGAASPIVHLVFWKLNGTTNGDKTSQADQIIAAFRALPPKVDGLMSVQVRQNCIDHPDAWDVSVYMLFSSAASLASYQAHPMHLAIKQLVGPMRLERGQVDFELDVTETNT